MNLLHKKKNGFTLVELIISIGIFSIFIIIVAGVLSRFVATQRHGIAQGALILDVQSAVESFIKEARTGYGSTYDVDPSGNQIRFRNQGGVCVSYRVSSAGIFERGVAPGDTESACPVGKFTNVTFTPITSTSTTITDILFDITPSAFNSTTLALENQGVITFTLTVTPEKSNITPITIQNTVTSRQTKAYDHPSI